MKPSRWRHVAFTLMVATIRVVFLIGIRLVYRVRAVHAERVPASGGVLLLPNHVTFADAFFLSAACPRPVRFVMDEAFIASPMIRWFTGIFGTVNIRREQPLEAIREVIKALKKGEVVCLFPEGQITRTGTLCTLQRGFELIASKAGHPLIPVWSDGSWGSIFSYERNCYFKKLPRRNAGGIRIAFGETLAAKGVNARSVRDGIMAASADAIAQRFSYQKFPQRRTSINGHQIGMINALQRRQPFHVLKGDPLLDELPGLTRGFAKLFRSKVCIRDQFDPGDGMLWVGSDFLREKILSAPTASRAFDFYDFGTQALVPLERPDGAHYPCLEVDGMVIAMSMPDPSPAQGGDPQHGRRANSWGKLLPGWEISIPPSGAPRALGPAADADGLALPHGCHLDDEGFLIRG
ncbi:MAG: 1-acyl-sn-glycerol-3-phosphate acyltransferase [Verrucomicrobia bacterium]|nr:1-acyl-sn-glycerol-3-phosphate acyltransferase [Verrucomicrobiota bacterium]